MSEEIADGKNANTNPAPTDANPQVSAVDALSGGATPTTDPRDVEIEKLRKELHDARVEQGRVRKLSQGEADLQKRIASLEAENAKLKATAQNPVELIPEGLRDQISPEQAQVVAAMANQIAESKIAELRARMEAGASESARNREIAENGAMQLFVSNIERELPGFIATIKPGQPNQANWLLFLSGPYGASVKAAFATHDSSAMVDLIHTFAEKYSVTLPGAGNPAPTPSPAHLPGNPSGSSDGRRYTMDEYQEAMQNAARLYDSHQIDAAKYQAMVDELNKARDEGRIDL